MYLLLVQRHGIPRYPSLGPGSLKFYDARAAVDSVSKWVGGRRESKEGSGRTAEGAGRLPKVKRPPARDAFLKRTRAEPQMIVKSAKLQSTPGH